MCLACSEQVWPSTLWQEQETLPECSQTARSDPDRDAPQAHTTPICTSATLYDTISLLPRWQMLLQQTVFKCGPLMNLHLCWPKAAALGGLQHDLQE